MTSELLEKAILHYAPSFIACDNAPNTWKDLKAWHASAKPGEPMPVYNGASERTIYSCDQVNFAFRAWHDSLHLLFDKSFSCDDELCIAAKHRDLVTAFGIMRGYPGKEITEAADLIYADVAGQVLYYAKYGEYVTDQALFVREYLQGQWFNLEG